MVMISFPDGRTKEFKKGITGFEVAEDISKSLSKEAIAVSVNGD